VSRFNELTVVAFTDVHSFGVVALALALRVVALLTSVDKLQ